MTIKSVHQKINNSISNFSTTPLKNTVIKAVGVFSILFGLAVIAGAAFLLYFVAIRMDMPHWKTWKDWSLIAPYGVMGICVLVVSLLSGGLSIVYGKKMLQAKLTDPKNPVAAEGDL